MRKFLSALFYFFWGLPLLLASLGLFGVLPWITDRGYYRSIVEDERLYRILSSPELSAGVDADLEHGAYSLHGPTLARGLQLELPEAELRTLGLSAVDQGADYFLGLRAREPELDLRPLKSALEKRLPAIAGHYYAEAPQSYRPSLPASPEELGVILSGALNQVPDTLELRPAPAGREAAFVRETGSLGKAAAVLALVAAAALAALAFLGGGGAAAVLARAGAMLGFPSVLVLLFGALLALPSASFLIQLLPPEAKALLDSGQGQELRSFLASILSPAARGFFVSGLAGASAAGLLKGLGRYLPREEEED